MNGTRITITRGSEGPRHDPYSYTEITVERLGRSVTLRAGLGVSLERDGKYLHDFTEGEMFELFEQWTGMDPSKAEKYRRRADSTCKQCGCKRAVYGGRGHPGEHFTLCARCHSIVHVEFNESEVI